MQLHKALNAIRLAERISQATLAERLGKQKDWYSRIETGKNEPTFKNLRAIATALQVPLWQVFALMECEAGEGVPEELSSLFYGDFPELVTYLEQSASAETHLLSIPGHLNLFEVT